MPDQHGAAAPAQWYPDPAGTGRLRWWDGYVWTDHYAPVPPPAPAAYPAPAPYAAAAPNRAGAPYYSAAGPYHAADPNRVGDPYRAPNLYYSGNPYYAPTPVRQPIVRPPLPEGTDVYTPLIWLIVLLPLIVVILDLFWHPSVSFVYEGPSGAKFPVMQAEGAFVASLLLNLAGWLLYAGTVVLAYFDWRRLERSGVVRPFHWAWAFLTSGVYVIGRSVIVHRVARPRGLTPVWVWIGVTALSLIVATVKLVELVMALTHTLPPNA